MGQLAERMGQLAERMDQLTERMDQLAERMDQLAERMDQLTGRMDQLAGRMDQLAESVDRLTNRVAALTEQLSRTNTRLDRAVGDLVELRYARKAHGYFQAIAQRIHVLDPDELEDVIEGALQAGQIDDPGAQELRRADIVIRAQREGHPVYLVVEASVQVDEHDVGRAAFRALTLGKTGVPTLAVAAGDSIIADAQDRAAREHVWLVTNGTVTRPPDGSRPT